MKQLIVSSLLTLSVLALALSGAGTAHAQYTVTGHTSGGGNIIVGKGNLPPLGPGAPLSPGGFDQVTINHGATASTIEFQTDNDSVILHGNLKLTISGSDNQGMLFDPMGDASGNSVSGSGNFVLSNDNNAENAGVTFETTGGDVFSNRVSLSGNMTFSTNNGGYNYGVSFVSVGGDVYSNRVSLSGNITLSTNNGGYNYGVSFFSFGGGEGDNRVSFSGNMTLSTNNGGSNYGMYFSASENGDNRVTNAGNIKLSTNNNGDNSGIVFSGNFNDGNWVMNTGNIVASTNGFGVSYGVDFGSASNINNSVTNTGSIITNAASTGNSFGVYFGSGGDSNTVTNYGNLSALGGANPLAISFTGDHNTVNLMGHSTTIGLISASGAANTNVLNVNFTGLSPAAIKNLKAQFRTQAVGLNDGMESSGHFVVRHVTYNYDPFVVNLNVSSYQLQGRTPNQRAVGASLDSARVSPAPGSPLFNLFNTIDASGNVPAALEALSPQKYQIYGDIAQTTANFLALEIDHRLNNLRDGSESIDTTGLGGETDKTTAGYSKDGKSVEVPAAGAPEKRWGFFASGDGIFSNIDAHGQDLTDAHYTTSDFIVGVDGKVNDNLVLGLLFNYEHTDADLDRQGSNADVDTFGGGLYAGYHNDGWYGNGLFDFAHNDYRSRRNIDIPSSNPLFSSFDSTAKARTNGNQYEVNVDGGYDFQVCDHLSIGPLAGLEYVRLDVDGFNEREAGAANLSIGSQGVDSLRSRLGVRAEYRHRISKEVVFATEARAEWQHEFLDDSRGINGAFIGSGLNSFSVQTTSPERDAAVVGAGLNFTMHEHLTLFADYDVQMAQRSYFEQSVKGGLRLDF